MQNEIVPVNKITEQDLTKHLENMGLIKDLTAGEKNTFLSIAQAFNLNPFKREIYVSKYNGTMSIIVGYETYIKRAERSGMLDGWEVTTIGTVAPVLAESTLKAVITIYRKDRTKPFVWEAKFTEYMQLKDGRLNKFWQKSETMIKKVVMAQGFRLCFNDELGGMPYTSEEINDTEDVSYTDAPQTSEPIKPDVIKKSALAKKGFDAAIVRIEAGEINLYKKLYDTYELTSAQVTALDAYKLKAEELSSAIDGLSVAEKPGDVDDFISQLPAYIASDASFVDASGKRREVLMATPA